MKNRHGLLNPQSRLWGGFAVIALAVIASTLLTLTLAGCEPEDGGEDPANNNGNGNGNDDGGLTWTKAADSTFGTNVIYSIAYGGGKFVAVGASGKIATSPDGTTWTAVTNTTFTYDDGDNGYTIYGITYGGDSGSEKFIAAGGNMAASPNGTTWTAITQSAISGVNSIAYGNGTWVAVGSNRSIAYSTNNGATWTAATTTNSGFGSEDSINGIAYGGGKFVAVGNGRMAASSDGITWAPVTQNAMTSYINSIAYGGSKWVAAGSGMALSTDDGVTWAKLDGISGGMYDIFYGQIYGIAYGGGKFVAGAFYRDTAYSTDGTNWTKVTNSAIREENVATTQVAHGIAYGGGKFVVGGDSGVIAYSNDQE